MILASPIRQEGHSSVVMGRADDAARACMIGRDRVASCVLPLHARTAPRRESIDRSPSIDHVMSYLLWSTVALRALALQPRNCLKSKEAFVKSGYPLLGFLLVPSFSGSIKQNHVGNHIQNDVCGTRLGGICVSSLIQSVSVRDTTCHGREIIAMVGVLGR
jgi:hypothetical protein